MRKLILKKKIGSAFIVFIAMMFIIFGLLHISLGLFGEKDTALITHIRRQGGERNEAVPNRYTYSLSYSFSLPDGKIVDGFTYKIGNAVYIKASGSNLSTINIRYLKALPQINAPDSEVGLKMGNLVIIGAGVTMIKLIKHRKKGVYRIKKVRYNRS